MTYKKLIYYLIGLLLMIKMPINAISLFDIKDFNVSCNYQINNNNLSLSVTDLDTLKSEFWKKLHLNPVLFKQKNSISGFFSYHSLLKKNENLKMYPIKFFSARKINNQGDYIALNREPNSYSHRLKIGHHGDFKEYFLKNRILDLIKSEADKLYKVFTDESSKLSAREEIEIYDEIGKCLTCKDKIQYYDDRVENHEWYAVDQMNHKMYILELPLHFIESYGECEVRLRIIKLKPEFFTLSALYNTKQKEK